jgi:hypothetical protein
VQGEGVRRQGNPLVSVAVWQAMGAAFVRAC